MIKIRLSRVGSRNKPFYNIVVCETRKKQVSMVLENLGFISPLHNEKKFNKERLAFWIGMGAQKSKAVSKIVK